MNNFNVNKLAIFIFCLFPALSSAQTDLKISGAQTVFPIAIPQLCDAGGGKDVSKKIASTLTKDLDLSGIFQIINPKTFIESPGKCLNQNQIAFSDWSVIGANSLIKGEVDSSGFSGITVKMYLYDVQRGTAVLGKKYSGSSDDADLIAHKFANEVMKFFTGEYGVFGSQIAYVARDGRYKEIHRMGMDGSNSGQLTDMNSLSISPDWSPDGTQIVFTSYLRRQPDLFSIPADGGRVKQLTNNSEMELGAEYSRDGRSLIASISGGGRTWLALFSANGQLIRNVTSPSAIDVSPSWSPDMRQIAFCSNRGGGPQIYISDANGGGAKRISFTGSNYCTSPAWSPKNDRIAFICRDGGNQLFMYDTKTERTSQLTGVGNNEDPDWSADGRFLAFSSSFGGSGTRNLAILSIYSGVPRQISFSRSENSQPTWSPAVK